MRFKRFQPQIAAPRPGSGSKRLLATITLCVLALGQLGTGAQADSMSGAAGHFWLKDPIVGTWDVLVNITNCATGDTIVSGAPSLALFNTDGTRHETNATSPALRTPGYGNWHRVRRNEYRFAFKFFRFDGMGVNVGSTSVRHDLVLSADRQSYYSEGPAEFFDPAGNLLFVGCANATATRFR